MALLKCSFASFYAFSFAVLCLAFATKGCSLSTCGSGNNFFAASDFSFEGSYSYSLIKQRPMLLWISAFCFLSDTSVSGHTVRARLYLTIAPWTSPFLKHSVPSSLIFKASSSFKFKICFTYIFRLLLFSRWRHCFFFLLFFKYWFGNAIMKIFLFTFWSRINLFLHYY